MRVLRTLGEGLSPSLTRDEEDVTHEGKCGPREDGGVREGGNW